MKVGTLALTASQILERVLRGRTPSSVPADAVGKALGVQMTGEAKEQRFSQIVHFGEDTLWGGFRGLH